MNSGNSIVVCVKVGNAYGPEYVNRLMGMLVGHTTKLPRFLCLTDDPKGLEVPYTDVGTDLPGWWAKLVLFRPHPAIEGRRVIYFDLDTVIMGNADFLFEYDGPFCVIKDWWAKGYNTSLMSIAPRFGKDTIWSPFHREAKAIMGRMHGDQDWVSERVKADTWQDIAPGKVGSYKADHLEAGPKDFSIACFHGKPKMADFSEGWVHAHWVQADQWLSVA